MNKITCFGEVLWDRFPLYKIIGGAPLNVAVRLKSLGNDVSVVSRVGDDKEGAEILDFFKNHGVRIEEIQTDETLMTGVVEVSLDQEGSASYDISYPSAWDNIKLIEAAIKQVSKSDALVFGSLAIRDAVSRQTLFELLKLPVFKVLDINLRPPHYKFDRVLDLMVQADFIKLNDEELAEVVESQNSSLNKIEKGILWLSKRTNTKSICVTRGGEGAILFFENKFYYNEGHEVVVVDTVGAGDSFLAGLIDKLLKNELPQKALDYASALGASVASRQGANPVISRETIEAML